MADLHLTMDPVADELISRDPFALLIGGLLDQQFPMERAFAGPVKIVERFGNLDPAQIAAADPEAFAELCATPPAVHRYGRSMAGRIQQLAQVIVDEYDGDAAQVWTEAESGRDLARRLEGLPGYGKAKVKMFVALLGKQLGVQPPGWEKIAGDYSQDGYRSIADVVDQESLLKVREYKKMKKAQSK
ncbi:Fe-S cluster assembly protein HesB [Gordonia iterans]|uniref:Fe-S cluster assembly protein HesB n=1 Tax=Gordonia iterans TaxID=1004901 RepID=A0A2S0KI31_9ACTN|nr:HhH-GPD-type base excision DNA repair protein [Gordonia iterans]AVM01323.1 Fe-S cluster assembly protein HesB [Gordonia iterans]